MKLKYLDGTESEDPLFDVLLEDQYAFVATALGLNPDTPRDWQTAVLKRLLDIRRTQGRETFAREISAMLTPPSDRSRSAI